MRNLSRLLLLSAALPLLAAASSAQQDQQLNAPARLLAARKLYYTPTAKGLKSFHCNAVIDWKAMLTRFSGGNPIADDDPSLVYLQATQMSVSDDLNSTGALQWTNTATAPEGTEQNVGQMQGGMEQMIAGFYQAWNQFMSGSMMTSPDSGATITATTDGGVHVRTSDPDTVFEEDFDKNMLLLSAHVVMKELESTAYPSFEPSTDGLRLSKVRNVLHKPPTAPPQEVTMSVTYMPVGAFQLPATLAVTLQGVGEFDFSFSSCVVNQ